MNVLYNIQRARRMKYITWNCLTSFRLFVLGLCNFPSDFVGKYYDSLYRLDPSQLYYFTGTQMIGDIEDMNGGQLITFTADCLEQNGDFVLAE